MTNAEPSSPESDRHPYSRLTPDTVMDALSEAGLRADGRFTALNSYENRVYLVHLEEAEPVVVKFYRPGRWNDTQIAEEHAYALELAHAEVPVVGPLHLLGQTLHHHAGFAWAASPRRGGRRPELDDPEVLEWIGRFLARLHTVGEEKPFTERPALNATTFGDEPVHWLLTEGGLPAEARPAWQAAAQAALEHARATLAECPDIAALRLHGDCHPGNILWTPTDRPGGGPHFVDLDDARTGPAVQDLWMLLSGDRVQQQRQLGALLDGYETVRPFDRRELRLIEALRTLRLLHYSAWLARRWTDPIFPVNFPWFGSASYWLEQAQTLWEQVHAMEGPALVA